MCSTTREVTPAPGPPSPTAGRPASPRPADGDVARELRRMLAAGELDLPRPGGGGTDRRWAALAAWGGRDLSLARLAEGHVDACAILAEAGRTAAPDALYGVWASRSGGATVQVGRREEARVLDGGMRFCSGARVLDRALVVAEAEGGRVLLDVDLTRPGVDPLPGTWCTAAMAAADTLDVAFAGVPVDDDADVGEPGWYVTRPGFALGGAGVAAVWWGGAASILARAVGYLGGAQPPSPAGGGSGDVARPAADPDRHALAHVGELHAALAAAEALLQRTAAWIDGQQAPAGGGGSGDVAAGGGGADRGAGPPVGTGADAPRRGSGTGAPPPHPDELALAVATVRAAVERAVRDVVDRVPRIVGPGPLSRDAGLAGALADLALYVRQHHAERDHAALGELVVRRGRAS